MLWIQGIPARPVSPPCPSCGMTLRELSSGGRVGCAKCYDHFKDTLRPYIRRLSNDTSHVGGVPASAGPGISMRRRLANMEKEMQQAIAEQQFERCAAIRDEMAALREELDT